MKNLIFKIKWLIKFRLQLSFTKEDCIAIVTDTFADDVAGNKVLDLYRLYKAKGYRVFILCAFNNAPMGRYLDDLRHIYIFNNNPEIFVDFCFRKKISALHYVDKDMMLGATSVFGFNTRYSVCSDLMPETAVRLTKINSIYFLSADNLQQYSDITGRNNGLLADENTDYTF